MLSVVFGLLLLAVAVGVWWLGVRTMEGQRYEDMVWSKFDAALPGWLEPVVHVFTISTVVIATSAIMSIIALAVLIVRKRWLLIAQLAVFGGICFAAAELLKPLLPRPYLINLESNPNNSAPSGHVILAAAAGVILLCAVPRVCRALVAVIGWLYAVLVGLSVIAGQWHRPTDVIMALLIVGGVAMITLAATFANGMDEPGSRVVAFRADRRQRAVDVRRARHPVWRIHYLADSAGTCDECGMDEFRRAPFHGDSDGFRCVVGVRAGVDHASADRLAIDETWACRRTSGPSETLTAKRTITPKISGTGRSRHTDGLPTAYGQ